ncbi:MAG: carbohydrate ABC transporter permease [Chloroflexi bacterium]|nr:carbohydrate ABC transporter permease [Chloroflexota bacterium]
MSGRRALTYTVVVLLILATAFPFLWLLQMSLKTEIAMFEMPPKLLFVPSLRNYADVLTGDFLRSFRNSTVASVATTILSLLIGVPAAYGLARARFRSDGLLSYWVLGTRMAPPIAFAIPFFLAYRQAGLIDTVPGLILIYLTFNLSLVIWMMRTFFEGLPRSLEEAAFIDGAGITQTFLRVTLPLSAPGLATTAIFCFLMSWNDFFYALVLTRTQAMTAPVAVVNFMAYQGWEWGKITAGGTLIMLPVVIFSFAVRKYLIHGLTAGAVKG